MLLENLGEVWTDPEEIARYVWEELEDYVKHTDAAYLNLPTGTIKDTILAIAAGVSGLSRNNIRELVTAAVAWWLDVYDVICEGVNPTSISDAILYRWSREVDLQKAPSKT